MKPPYFNNENANTQLRQHLYIETTPDCTYVFVPFWNILKSIHLILGPYWALIHIIYLLPSIHWSLTNFNEQILVKSESK